MTRKNLCFMGCAAGCVGMVLGLLVGADAAFGFISADNSVHKIGRMVEAILALGFFLVGLVVLIVCDLIYENADWK